MINSGLGLGLKPKPHLLQHLRRAHGVHGRQRGQAQVLILQRGADAKHLRPLARARLAQRPRLRSPSPRPEQCQSAGTPLPAASVRFVAWGKHLQLASAHAGGARCLSGPAKDGRTGLLWRRPVINVCKQ